MNKQEVFDKVVKHLLTQKACSEDDMRHCKYRGPNGLMCAVGCLITDKAYAPHLEGKVANSFEVANALEKSGVDTSPDVLCLLYGLQKIHDRCDVDNWEQHLRSVADEFHLTFPEHWRHALSEVADQYELVMPGGI